MLKSHNLLDGNDHQLPVTYAAAPRDDAVLAEVAKYDVCAIPDMEEGKSGYVEYRDFLQHALRPLGLYRDHLMPDSTSTCYRVARRDRTAAIFRLTPTDQGSVFHRVIPNAARMKILAVNNVAIDPDARGDLLLGIILKQCALRAFVAGYHAVAGIVRHDVLPLFVDFGTVPVRHDPLHVLGDATIFDYVTYFMTHDPMHVDYALARSYHYFHRKVTMRQIEADVNRMRAVLTENGELSTTPSRIADTPDAERAKSELPVGARA